MSAAHEEDKVVFALADLCKEQEVKTLIQVGAGDGYEAYIVREQMGCRAIAIDGNKEATSFDSSLEFHHEIIGAVNCPVVFFVNQDPSLSGILPRANGQEMPYNTLQQRLDSWCLLHGGIKPDALIIDTEGTTLDVLEGCGDLLDEVKVIYAECQTEVSRPGIRLLGDVDSLLVAKGMTQCEGLPSYDAGKQGNYTWVRNET